MASIKDAIEECIMDRNAVFKYLIIAVPLYMTYNTSLNGIKEGSAILEKLSSLTSADPYWGSAAALILFGMALITTHNVINTNNHVLPTANIFSFAFQTIIGFISLIPAIVFYSLVPGILIANLSKVVPENIANPINFIITAICQFCIFSAYIMYSKKYQFKDSLNFQLTFSTIVETSISILYCLILLFLVNMVTTGFVIYLFWIFKLLGTPLFTYILAFMTVLNTAIFAHCLAQVGYEKIIKEENKDRII